MWQTNIDLLGINLTVLMVTVLCISLINCHHSTDSRRRILGLWFEDHFLFKTFRFWMYAVYHHRKLTSIFFCFAWTFFYLYGEILNFAVGLLFIFLWWYSLCLWFIPADIVPASVCCNVWLCVCVYRAIRILDCTNRVSLWIVV